MEKIGIYLLNPRNDSTHGLNCRFYILITNCREHYLRLGSNGRVQICKSIRPTSMHKSIFSTSCLPRPNSISATHLATKLWRQGCRRKAKSCCPNDRVDCNDFNHNNTFGNPLHNIQKVSLCFLITKGMLPLVPIKHNTPRHRAHGYFHRSCKFGFGRSHVGAFRIHGSTPIAIVDHRLPPRI